MKKVVRGALVKRGVELDVGEGACVGSSRQALSVSAPDK